MANSVQELIEMLYSMVNEAWGLPLGAEKCVIERNKVLDLLDEIKTQLPVEISEAKKLVAVRSEYIANAKREADSIRKVAEEQARRLVDEQEITKVARAKCHDMVASAEKRATELRRVANDYAEDALKRTEEAISDALDEVRQSRIRFRSAVGSTAPSNTPNVDVPNIDEDEN